MRLFKKSSFLLPVTALFVILLIQGCGEGRNPFAPNYEHVPAPYDKTKADTSYTTPEGLTIYVIERGNGAFQVNSRDHILVRYTGRTKDGKIFDSTYRENITTRRLTNLTPVPIPGPTGPIPPLIEGFREGLLGMKEGGKRILVIPPSLGYGNNEGHELQNDTLVFDVELVGIL